MKCENGKKYISNPCKEDLKYIAKYADKYRVKTLVNNFNIPSLSTAKILGTYKCFDDIDINVLPRKFVIKCNHWCGDSKIIDSHDTFHKKYNNLKTHFNSKINKVYRNGAEPHYSHIPPILFIEEYLNIEKYEYKLFCIWGEPVIIQYVHCNNSSTLYSINKKKLNSKFMNQNSAAFQPDNTICDNVIEIARILTKEMPFVRLDFFITNDEKKIYFGEYTFTPMGCANIFNSKLSELLYTFYKTKEFNHNLIEQC